MDDDGQRSSLRERWASRCLAHPRLTVVGVVVGCIALFLVIASALAWSEPSRPRSGSSRNHTSELLFSVGVLVVGVVVLVSAVSSTLRRARRTRDISYSRQRRAQVEKALRRGESLSGHDLPVAASIVQALHPPWLYGFIAAGVVLVNVRILLFDSDEFPWWSVVAVALVAAAFGLSAWHHHRLVRNLRRLTSRATGP